MLTPYIIHKYLIYNIIGIRKDCVKINSTLNTLFTRIQINMNWILITDFLNAKRNSLLHKLTLCILCNCLNIYIVKPLLIYKSNNPKAFKNMFKANLPVHWKANRKSNDL